MNVNTDTVIVCISYLEACCILWQSFICGLWIVLKRAIFDLVYRISSRQEEKERNSPPLCLVGSTFGRHSYLKVKGKGVKFHYVESGDPDKPVVILLHGFPDCWISWHRQIPVLAQHFRVIAIDLKGFGDSDKPTKRNAYGVRLLISELVSFVNSLSNEQCYTLIGHDLGALLGWYLIHLHPHLFQKFVAISCPHPNIFWSHIPDSSLFNKNWVNFSQMPLLPELDALRNDVMIINQCYQHLATKSPQDGENFVEAYKYVFSRKEDWTGPINYFRNLPFCRLRVSKDSDTPTCLLITGNKDCWVQLESVVRSTEYINKYYVKIVPDASHYPHQQCAEVVNDALLAFMVEECDRDTETVQNGLLRKMFGSFSSTVKYGNDMISNMKKDIKSTPILQLLNKMNDQQQANDLKLDKLKACAKNDLKLSARVDL